jgi:hypothetical protein
MYVNKLLVDVPGSLLRLCEFLAVLERDLCVHSCSFKVGHVDDTVIGSVWSSTSMALIPLQRSSK